MPAAVKKKKRPRALYDPTQPLQGKRLRRSSKLLTALEFDPQRRALEREEAKIVSQGNAGVDRASTYYRDVVDRTQGDVSTQAAIGELLRQKIGASGAEAQAGISNAVGQAAQLRRADEFTRGPGLDGGSNASAMEAQAAAQRAAAAQQQGLDSEAQGTANYQQLSDLSRRATAAQGGETQRELLLQLANQRAGISDKRSALEASAAGKQRQNVLDLRQQGFENLVTMEGLGIKREDLQADIENSKADQALAKKKLRQQSKDSKRRARLQRRQIAATRRGQDISAETQRRGQDISAQQQERNRASREAIARSKKTKRPMESSDARKVKQGIVNAVADMVEDPKLKNKPPAEQARILRKRGAPAVVIRAARERSTGGLNADTAAELRALGIRVPKAWLRGGSTYNKGNQPG